MDGEEWSWREGVGVWVEREWIGPRFDSIRSLLSALSAGLRCCVRKPRATVAAAE